MKRFQWVPPWQLSYFFGKGLGCDEWHNKSVYLVTPLGSFVVFYGPFSRKGEEHLWAQCQGVEEGLFVPHCDICIEIREAFK